jgi:hypothetical protein
MSLTRFCASPSGRYITNAAGEPVLEFAGFTEAEDAKRILLTGCHLRPILGERAASIAGHSPIPAEAFDPALRAALSYLTDRVRADPAALKARSWEIHGHVIKEFPAGEAIATLLIAPPWGFDALMAAPQLCAAAMEIVAGGPQTLDVEELLAA